MFVLPGVKARKTDSIQNPVIRLSGPERHEAPTEVPEAVQHGGIQAAVTIQVRPRTMRPAPAAAHHPAHRVGRTDTGQHHGHHHPDTAHAAAAGKGLTDDKDIK